MTIFGIFVIAAKCALALCVFMALMVVVLLAEQATQHIARSLER